MVTKKLNFSYPKNLNFSILIFFTFIFLGCFNVSAQRAMYVRLTETNFVIIDDVANQNPTAFQTHFLKYARDNGKLP
jgi:hypothetical protein